MVYLSIKGPSYSDYSDSVMDHFVFKLCYRWTVWLLVAFSFIVTCRLWFGDSFSCITENDVLPLNYVNTKCYDNGVYFVPWYLDNDKKGKLDYEPGNENDKRYQSYYSWVNLVLLVHALNFCLPHLLLKSYAGRYVYRLTGGFIHRKRKDEEEISYIAKQVVITRGSHGTYAFGYNFFEACNFVVSLAQTMWLIHFFQVTGVSVELRTWSEFKNFYFPEEAACELTKFSASDNTVTFRAVCQLPLNSLYMKMFLFLRTWYIFLTILCGLVLIFRIITLITPKIRFYAIRFSSPFISRQYFSFVLDRFTYSDWFFLCRIQKAMNDVDFHRMIRDVSCSCRNEDGMMNAMSPVSV